LTRCNEITAPRHGQSRHRLEGIREHHIPLPFEFQLSIYIHYPPCTWFFFLCDVLDFDFSIPRQRVSRTSSRKLLLILLLLNPLVSLSFVGELTLRARNTNARSDVAPTCAKVHTCIIVAHEVKTKSYLVISGDELEAFLARHLPEYDRIIYVGDGENDFCPILRMRRWVLFPLIYIQAADAFH